ncbi:MAG: rhomboid family intramembrane serine protease [Candidatus Bathycorpusculaceae bacterium]
MFPIKDLNKPFTTPHITRILIIVNVVAFVFMWLSYYHLIDARFAEIMEKNLPLTPIDIIEFKTEKFYTLFTSMFLHAGLIHLFGNMLYLHIFGDNVEDVFGHGGYLAFYLICGLAASAAHILSLIILDNPALYEIPVVGASGAISGVLGAYLVLYPKSRILTIVVYGWAVLIPIPAFIFLGIWFLMQWLLGMYDIIFFGDISGVAYWAHIGGFIAGMILALIFGLERKKAREKRFRF